MSREAVKATLLTHFDSHGGRVVSWFLAAVGLVILMQSLRAIG